MQELSFIKKEGGNASDFFIDSFLHDKDFRQACNIEDDGLLKSNIDLKNIDGAGAYKDVNTEEYDLDDSGRLVDDQSNLEVLKKISEATRKAASSSFTRPDSAMGPNDRDPDSEANSMMLLDSSPDDYNPKGKNNKFKEIDKISEDDAEYEEDDSQIDGGLSRRMKSKKY